MYIQNHHIQNVLNEYRKRLSQPTGSKAQKQTVKATIKDTVQLSDAGQRQSLIDQVSADIFQRISQAGSRNGNTANYLDTAKDDPGEKKNPLEMDFVYTTIDENDQKSTQIIPITHLRPSMASLASGEEPRDTGEEATGES